MRLLNKIVIVYLITLPVCAGYLFALKVPEKPGDHVTDYTATLSSNNIFALNQKLANYEEKTTNQIAVLIIQSLEGDNLEDYSIRLADKWKIGQKGKDNGVILLVVKKDRRLRIEVGYGLEHLITDSKSGSIVRNTIIPLLRENKFFEGINNGIDDIIKTISPDSYRIKGTPTTNTSHKPHWIVRYIVIIALSPFIVIVIICIIFYRKESLEIGKEYMGMRGWGSPQDFWQRVGGPSGVHSGAGVSFGGGGGGFGGGGGGFGGGGASGSW
jgi:uncharacterized protein